MHEKYMMRALELAQLAAAEGEVPVGAVVVHKTDGKIIGEGRNRREAAKNALAHAELEAIAQACRSLGGWRLPDCAIYVTLEPCPMCCGAVINARIDEVYFGAYDKKSGSAVSVQDMFSLPYNWSPEPVGGVLEEKCAAVLQNFFRGLRIRGKRWKKGGGNS
ncbi:MAG: nucleoside deaminase [Ruminococcus sp.]|nr:nucleoside deaminase [Ruminococcus sp.]